MKTARDRANSELSDDPFGERRGRTLKRSFRALGCRFDFAASNAELMHLAAQAYDGLPRHSLSRSNPRFFVDLKLSTDSGPLCAAPPKVSFHSGAGLLCGVMDAGSFVAVQPKAGTALLTVSPAMLAHAYNIRYELLEFAGYVLAGRTQRLTPLHAACFGVGKRGALLIGDSGAGKSTLALHALLAGLDFIAEDSVLVDPVGLRATGVANFLHLTVGAQHFLPRVPRWLADSPTIHRRSGVAKHEIDLRRTGLKLARAPQRIEATFVLSAEVVTKRRPLVAQLKSGALLRHLAATQPYAATQPGWQQFCRTIARGPSYLLRRPPHPVESIAAIRSLLV